MSNSSPDALSPPFQATFDVDDAVALLFDEDEGKFVIAVKSCSRIPHILFLENYLFPIFFLSNTHTHAPYLNIEVMAAMEEEVDSRSNKVSHQPLKEEMNASTSVVVHSTPPSTDHVSAVHHPSPLFHTLGFPPAEDNSALDGVLEEVGFASPTRHVPSASTSNRAGRGTAGEQDIDQLAAFVSNIYMSSPIPSYSFTDPSPDDLERMQRDAVIYRGGSSNQKSKSAVRASQLNRLDKAEEEVEVKLSWDERLDKTISSQLFTQQAHKPIREDGTVVARDVVVCFLGPRECGKSSLMGQIQLANGVVDRKALYGMKQKAKKAEQQESFMAWLVDCSAEERSTGKTLYSSCHTLTSKGADIPIIGVNVPVSKESVGAALAAASYASVAVMCVHAGMQRFEKDTRLGGPIMGQLTGLRCFGMSICALLIFVFLSFQFVAVFLLCDLTSLFSHFLPPPMNISLPSGHKSVLIAVTHMDEVQWRKDRFDAIAKVMQEMCQRMGFLNFDVVPVGPVNGENVESVSQSRLKVWYKGATFLSAFKNAVEDQHIPTYVSEECED